MSSSSTAIWVRSPVWRTAITRSTASRRARNSASVRIGARRRPESRLSRRRWRLASSRVEPLTPRTPSSSAAPALDRPSRMCTTVFGGSSSAASAASRHRRTGAAGGGAGRWPTGRPRRPRRRARRRGSSPASSSWSASASAPASVASVLLLPRPRRPRRRRRRGPSPCSESASASSSLGRLGVREFIGWAPAFLRLLSLRRPAGPSAARRRRRLGRRLEERRGRTDQRPSCRRSAAACSPASVG